jgi:hypothetical protein
VTAYSFTVANAVTTLTLTPTVNDPNATVMVNNGNPIALAVGANPILVEVTAQDGTTKTTYTVTVTRDPSERRDAIEPDQQHRHAHPQFRAGGDGL